jgi:hypothetical protein
MADRARGVVLRRGAVPGPRAAELVGCPLLGTLPALGRSRSLLDPGRPPRAVARVARGILRGLVEPAGRHGRDRTAVAAGATELLGMLP